MNNKVIIKKLLKESLIEGLDKYIVVGGLIKCVMTNRVLLVLRNDKIPVWALVSGGVEKGETPIEALKREIYEELSIRSNNIVFHPIRIEYLPERNMVFHYFQGFVKNEFTPILDHENLKFQWADLQHLPSHLYNGLKEKIVEILK